MYFYSLKYTYEKCIILKCISLALHALKLKIIKCIVVFRGYLSPACIIQAVLVMICEVIIHERYLRAGLQQRGAHALGAAHAEVEALGGAEALGRPHQVKQVGRGGGGAGGGACHASKEVTSAGAGGLSGRRHLTSGEGVPLPEVSVAAGGRSGCNERERKRKRES